jgi:hypothetical protein
MLSTLRKTECALRNKILNYDKFRANALTIKAATKSIDTKLSEFNDELSALLVAIEKVESAFE